MLGAPYNAETGAVDSSTLNVVIRGQAESMCIFKNFAASPINELAAKIYIQSQY
jgi:hypothetical protein